MNARNDSVIVPSLHDTLSDARTGGAGMADEQPDDAFPAHDTDDPAYVAAMQQREAALSLGYVDALCLGCGCLLYVPAGRRCGDILCGRCEAEGNALAADEDGDDTDPPPAASAPVPERSDPEYFAPVAGRLGDDQLVTAVSMADREPEALGLDSDAVRDAALSAFTAEVLRRIDRRPPARLAA